MRIAISGVQGTGKTTLLHLILDRYHTVDFFRYTPLFEETVRTLLKRGLIGNINREGTFRDQLTIVREHEKISRNPRFIADRCAWDSLSYGLYLKKVGKITEEQYSKLERVFKQALKRYDAIFYLPIEFNAVPDGVRDVDEKYRQDMDECFREIARKFDIKFISLLGNPDKRYNSFIKHCEEIEKRNKVRS